MSKQSPLLASILIAAAGSVLVGCSSEEKNPLPKNSRLTEVFRSTVAERASDLGVYRMALECPGSNSAVHVRIIGPGLSEEVVAGELPCSEEGPLLFVRYGLRDGHVVSSRHEYDNDLVVTALTRALDRRFGTLALVPSLSDQVSREHMVAFSASGISEVEFMCDVRTLKFRYSTRYSGASQEGQTSVPCKVVESGHAAVRLVNLRTPVPRELNYETSYSAHLTRMGQPTRVRVDYVDTYRVLTTKDVAAEDVLTLMREFAHALGPRKTF